MICTHCDHLIGHAYHGNFFLVPGQRNV